MLDNVWRSIYHIFRIHLNFLYLKIIYLLCCDQTLEYFNFHFSDNQSRWWSCGKFFMLRKFLKFDCRLSPSNNLSRLPPCAFKCRLLMWSNKKGLRQWCVKSWRVFKKIFIKMQKNFFHAFLIFITTNCICSFILVLRVRFCDASLCNFLLIRGFWPQLDVISLDIASHVRVI